MAPTAAELPEAAPVDWAGEPEEVLETVGLEPEGVAEAGTPDCWLPEGEAAGVPVAAGAAVGMSERVIPAEAQRPETAGMISVAYC